LSPSGTGEESTEAGAGNDTDREGGTDADAVPWWREM